MNTKFVPCTFIFEIQAKQPNSRDPKNIFWIVKNIIFSSFYSKRIKRFERIIS